MREMALVFGVTERRIARILKDLIEARMIRVNKRRRRNSYSIVEEALCLHPSLPDLRLGDVVRVVQKPDEPSRNVLHGLMFPFAIADSEGALNLVPFLM